MKTSASIRSHSAFRRSPRHEIRGGDKVYARLMLNGRQIVEFVLDQVSDLSELLSELRYVARRYSGLAKLYVRNMSRGWSLERPLMLYSNPVSEVCEAPRQHQIMPWETH